MCQIFMSWSDFKKKHRSLLFTRITLFVRIQQSSDLSQCREICLLLIFENWLPTRFWRVSLYVHWGKPSNFVKKPDVFRTVESVYSTKKNIPEKNWQFCNVWSMDEKWFSENEREKLLNNTNVDSDFEFYIIFSF